MIAVTSKFRRSLFAWIAVVVLSFFLILPGLASAQRTLRAGIDSGLPPFSFVDSGSSSVRGFNIDLIKMLAGSLGAKIKFLPMDGHDLERRLAEEKVDLIIKEKSISNPSLQFLQLPTHLDRKLFVNTCYITVTCVRDLPGHSVVILKGDDLRRLIPDQDRIRFIEAETQERALEIVNSSTGDVYLSPSGISAVYSIQKSNFRSIKEVGLPVESVPPGHLGSTGGYGAFDSIERCFWKDHGEQKLRYHLSQAVRPEHSLRRAGKVP